MADSAKWLILKDLGDAIATISIANGYNTDIIKVVKGKVINPESLHPTWQSALAQVRMVRVENTRTDGHMNEARAFFQAAASMTNVTFANFAKFLDDIEDVISNDFWRDTLTQTAGTYYEVRDTHVESIEIGSDQEFDEMLDSSQEQYKRATATILIVVDFDYIPNLLSEVASG